MTPIKYRNFKGAVDPEFFDAETGGTDLVAKTTNLTPFRKVGALVQCPGFVELTPSEDLPSPSGFTFIEGTKFSVDRDQKEITLLVYKSDSTDETKLYISPYYNPNGNFSNFNELENEETWVDEWLELTENTTSNVIFANDGANTIELTTALGQVDYYYNGWFMVNESLPNTDLSKYNYVNAYLQTANQFILKASTATWTTSHTVRMFRFPCVYMYKAVTPNAEQPNYEQAGELFDAIPTDYINGINELRVPCGKENRPLSLEMVYKRKYVVGNEPMSYDGFWFDFQQPQQVLYKSVISSYGDSIGTVSTTYAYITPTDRTHFLFVAPATPYLRLKYIGSTADRVKIISSATLPLVSEYAYENGVHTITLRYTGGVGDALFLDLKAVFDTYLSSLFEVTLVGTPAGILGTWDMSNTFVYGTGSIIGVDAGNNKIAQNLFLGTQVQALTPAANTDPGCPMIFSLVLSNRNEVIIGHGNICTQPSIGNSGAKLFFNCWFSRKITSIRVYNGTSLVLSSATVSATNIYPYFSWLKGMKINELPLLFQMSFENPIQPFNGEAEDTFLKVDNSKAFNSYLFSTHSWYLHICKEANAIDVIGKGFKFIVSINRYIDQDTTMNYTRGVFTGQINGRHFIIGCKNNIEKDLFENDDFVLMSNYAVGVSAYDIFLKDRSMQIHLGDKDYNVGIAFNRGRLLVVKNANNYIIDVNQANEINYRIIDTVSGRGTNRAKSIANTPYGTIICSSDTVWIVNSNGAQPLLTNTNGRLQLYKDKFAGENVQCIYYNKYDELIIFVLGSDEDREDAQVAYALVYSFRAKHWTNYEYLDSVVPVSVSTDIDQNVVIFNQDADGNVNMVTFDEDSSNFIAADGSVVPIHWEFETQAMTYLDNKADFTIDWSKNAIDYKGTTPKLKFELTTDNDVDKITTYSSLATSSVVLKNHLILNLFSSILFQYLTINITNKDESNNIQPFDYLSINNLILNISPIQEKYSVK